MIKKFLLSATVILLFVFYVAYERGFFRRNANTPELYSTPSYATPDGVPYATPQTNGQFKDGEYTGPVTDAFFGPFQVKAIIVNGKLADIQFLQYPNDRPTSISINTNAIPIMKQEAIAAQGAKVDIVTGATQSTEAFQRSLAAALAQASNNQ